MANAMCGQPASLPDAYLNPVLLLLVERALADLAREYRLVEGPARLRVVVEAHPDLLVQLHAVLAVDQPGR